MLAWFAPSTAVVPNMMNLSDAEPIQIIAGALHSSGPSLNPGRIDIRQARLRANVVVRELRHHGVVVIRQESAPGEAAR
jgi:hypothetical protein